MQTMITGTALLDIGYHGKLVGMALELMRSNFAHVPARDVLALFKKVKDYPESFVNDPVLRGLANEFIMLAAVPPDRAIRLAPTPAPYAVFGESNIEEGAREQMNVAMRLPVAAAGALMPDAHQGYGLPIGGVLATRNSVIPYGVGVDIGCRMALSIFDIPAKHYSGKDALYKRELLAFTRFGAGQAFRDQERAEHEVIDRPEFNATSLLRSLRGKAWAQLGTSGGGNHFVEWGIIDFATRDDRLNIDAGRYVALLSHSGSRGLGATIAGHYTKVAKERCQLPREAVNLAYLDLDTAEGQEYWLSMTLAGDYASACHDIIHRRLTKAIGARVLARIENHHNFAWKENLGDGELIVHRKGATPAGEGVMGIIPGSMTAPGFLVSGRGETSSIHSAAHGAGRQMSRTKAVQSISRSEMKAVLKDHGVTLIGGGLDEAPMAYKDISKVMAAQTDLVDVVATFEPKMVRMADDGSRED